jgi:hypothetical protein
VYNLGLSLLTGGRGCYPDPFTHQIVTAQQSTDILVDTVKGLVAYDEWAQDPGAAAGTVAVNIGSFFLGGGVSVAARAAGAGKTVEKAAATTGTAAKLSDTAKAAEAADLAKLADHLDLPAADDLTHAITTPDKLSIPDLTHPEPITPPHPRPEPAPTPEPCPTPEPKPTPEPEPSPPPEPHPEPVVPPEPDPHTGVEAHSEPATPAHDTTSQADDPLHTPAHDDPAAATDSHSTSDHEPDHPNLTSPDHTDPATTAPDPTADSHPASDTDNPDQQTHPQVTTSADHIPQPTGDTHASDGSDLKPGETHTTMRGYSIRAMTAADVARLDELAAAPDSPILAIDGHYELRDPIDVDFNADHYFTDHGINPDAEYQPGVTYRQEYDRQLDLQQDGLNNLTISEWQHNVADYGLNHRIGQSDQAAARVDAGGVPGDDTAILHGPDQIAGGRPDTYYGLGDTHINSSIGSQWKTNMANLQRRVDPVVDGIPDDLQEFIHMNIHLVSK